MRIKLCLLLILSVTGLNAEKVGILENVFNPKSMAVYKNILYVADQDSVLAFSLPGLKQINKFVRKGQGPGEFPATPFIRISQDKLLVQFSLKYAFFNPSGKLLSERYVPFFFSNIAVMGDNYFLAKMSTIAENGKLKFKKSIALYNKENKLIKTIFEKDITFKQSGKKSLLPIVNTLYKFIDYKDKIYLVSSPDEFKIDIYNQDGSMYGFFKLDYQPIEITEEEREKRLEEYLSQPAIKKKGVDSFKSVFIFTFPDYYPPIKDFFISGDRIYVKTYLAKSDKEEYWILTLDGKMEKKVLLPRINERLSTFSQGKFFYLIENDNEDWECHCLKID